MPRQTINPPTLFNSLQYGFSQIALGAGSRFVTVSGQVARDADGYTHADMGLYDQAIKSFDRLADAMQAAGGSLDDILLLHIYIVDSVMAENAAISRALKQVFPQNPPASSWIGVPSLANPGFLVEIEALAVLA